MPPVRWKHVPIFLLSTTFLCTAQMMQDAISMTSDGWRPIIGTRKEPQIIYHNKFETQTIAAHTSPITAPPHFPSGPTLSPMRNKPQHRPNKIPAHTKIVGPFYALTSQHGGHGPIIPISSVTHGRPGQSGQLKKYPTSSHKPPQFIMQNNRHKVKQPMRVQTTNHGNRDELFTASATSGAYSLFNKGQNNNKVKTRETVGLAIPTGPGGGGNSHYSINQPHAHIEFNRFSAPQQSDPIFQHFNNAPAVQNFLFPKLHPQINDVNVNYQFQKPTDDFTRNLVPPPARKHKDVTEKNQIYFKANHPENVIVQLPPPFQYSQQLPNDNFEITKEKLNVFRNNIPSNYKGDYVDYDYHNIKVPTMQSGGQQTYEVTEGKFWDESPQPYIAPSRRRKPQASQIQQQVIKKRPEIELNFPPFLPTPYSPEGQGVVPTSPTQAEVSTIFTKLSVKQKEKDYVTAPSPHSFNVKEVSTHFPILGKPLFDYDTQTQEVTNDIATTTTTEAPVRSTSHRRRRPSHRLRTTTAGTTTTTTTTEEPEVVDVYELQKTQESVETEKPVRSRRPSHRHRTTTPAASNEYEDVPVKVSRVRGRYKLRQPNRDFEEVNKERRRRPAVKIVTEVPENHKTQTSDETELQTTEIMSRESTEDEDSSERGTETLNKVLKYELDLPEHNYDLEKTIRYNILNPIVERVTTAATTTEKLVATTTLPPLEPENEIEYYTSTETVEEPLITTTTTTTTAAPSATSKRIRGRPIKYDNSNRPRFSVKDYRQKFTSTTSTTESSSRPSDSPKIRMPGRLRRPTSTTTAASNDEDSTEPSRQRFTPKDPRHNPTTESSGNDVIITEKNVKAVNTRLRPFGRYRSTTATTTTTPKVSIKPNLFSARKRPPIVSLRNRILNKKLNNTANSQDKLTTTTEEAETKETTLNYNQEIDVTTEVVKKTKLEATTIENEEDDVEPTTADILKNESYIYSQRVSDLTSSSQNEYNTPGLFKNVSPTSRRVPNYFTIATDDPILPIEAFFPNIKDKARK